jgi:general secretion pathway protein L
MAILEASQPWSLFGYDLRQGYFWFRAGWRDFLWGSDSPILPIVDEPVAVYSEGDRPHYFLAGKPVKMAEPIPQVECQAVVLPDRLLLPRKLTVPRAAEGNLDSVVALEVQANSPFPPDDTCYGWSIMEESEPHLTLQLVISSNSAVMEYIAGRFDCHDRYAYEVWAMVDETRVLIRGFGENARRNRNRKRMVGMGLRLAYCLALLVTCFGVAAGMKYVELQRVEAMNEEVRSRAESAMALRSRVSDSKERLAAVNDMIAGTPDLQVELARLSRLLGDDTWLAQFDIKDSRLRIEGQSPDAAKVMQSISDQNVYERVTAPVAIRKVSRGNLERFVLDLVLKSQETIQ